jgi:hypothetical protein
MHGVVATITATTIPLVSLWNPDRAAPAAARRWRRWWARAV